MHTTITSPVVCYPKCVGSGRGAGVPHLRYWELDEALWVNWMNGGWSLLASAELCLGKPDEAHRLDFD